MSLNLSAALPSLPDTSSLPSVGDVGEIVGDVVVSAIDTAGEAATVVVETVVDTARRKPRMAMGLAAAAIVALVAMMIMRRRRRPHGELTDADQPHRVAAA
jgi:hypothetical protein